ncbi:hypothetical protein BGZ99_005827 [Dissophora globulifera]|uniref:Uncharacterized protein n=1 Tax=Dissophora globulifera TaxID=979702 RepID=A0A9P6RIB5_9FUNG|nr:hypothetical protein BGZ99_005827 [Dissophora globulifera]
MRKEFKHEDDIPECIDEAGKILALQYAHHAGYARGLMSTLKKFPLTALRPEFTAIQDRSFPVQVIWGTKDTVIPGTTIVTLQQLVPRIKVTKVEGATHSISMTHPDAIIEQLEIFGPQFVWWLGHVLLLICATFYLPYWLTFSSKAGAHWYTRAFLGAIVSYGVVVYKSFPEIKFEAQFLQSVLVEENTQYFLMAIFWWRSTPMIAPLIPYVVFAFFNSLNYTRTNLLPAIFPTPAAGSADAKASQIANILRDIQVWTEKNHASAMALVAYIEILGVMGSLIFGAITFQSSFLSPIVYGNFLRFRYFFSLHTRAAFADLRIRADGLVLGNPKIPPKGIQAYEILRGAITRFGMAAVQQPTDRTE